MRATGRLIVPELLDQAPDREAAASLGDLVRINRYLGGYRTLRWLMQQVVRRDEGFSLLDVGAASGDMTEKIRRWYPHARVTAMDYKANHLIRARPPKVVGNAFQFPFSSNSFDFVFCSLFLHHFPDEDVVRLLRGFRGLARRAVLAIDLERGPLGYHFLPVTKPIFGWHPITVHDGPASVQAAFKPDELRELAEMAGLKATVRVHRPWARLSLMGWV